MENLMNKLTTIKLSLLTLVFGGTVSCGAQCDNGSDNKIEPELKKEIELLENQGMKQDNRKLQKIVVPEYITPEYMNKLHQEVYGKQK